MPTIIEVQANSIQDAAILTEGIHTHVYWHFVLSSSDSFGIIEFDDGIVSLISIKPKKGAIRLAEAISLLGEPEKVLAYKETGEMRRLILYILYPSKGYALLYQSGEFRGESKEIEPNHSLERIFLFNPLSYVNIITEGPLEKLNPNLLDKYILPWKGYEEIFPVEKQD